MVENTRNLHRAVNTDVEQVQAQRPEVGVVGAKLLDHDGKVTQAGLILGMNDGVGSAFVGESKDAKAI